MKYIIDMSDEYVMESALYGKQLAIPFYVNANDKSFYLPTGLKLTPYTEPDREAIAGEVWGFVRIITDMSEAQRIECFGGTTCNLDEYLTYQEAKAKYEAWKKQKDELRVGDVVVHTDDANKEKMVVLRLYQPPQYKPIADVLCEDGTVAKTVVVKNLVWTGRHFSEVEELLKKMRGEV